MDICRLASFPQNMEDTLLQLEDDPDNENLVNDVG